MVQDDRFARDRRFAGNQRRDPGDDEFEIQPWNSANTRGQSRRGDTARTTDSPPGTNRTPPPSRSSGGRRDPLPHLGDAFQRAAGRESSNSSSQSSPPDRADRERRASRDRRTSDLFEDENRSRRSYLDDDDEPYDRLPPDSRADYNRGRRRPSSELGDRRTRPAPRAGRGDQLSGLLAAASPQVRELVPLAGLCIGSLLLMIMVTAVRIGSVAPWLPIHINAVGGPDLWGTRSSIWQLPLMAGMVTAMAGALSWFMSNRDAFIAKFAFLAALLIQALCWIGLIHFLW